MQGSYLGHRSSAGHSCPPSRRRFGPLALRSYPWPFYASAACPAGVVQKGSLASSVAAALGPRAAG
eukprot:9045222-Alexandrium_andersonii.AAC.1